MRDVRLLACAVILLALPSRNLSVAPAFAQAAAPVPRSSPIVDAWERFARGNWEYQPPLDELHLLSLVHDGIRRESAAWIRQRPDEIARRRLTVATHALVILGTLEGSALWQATQPASNLLEAACALLQAGPPSDAERVWHGAALVLLERSAPVDAIARHLEHAQARFPDEPRWMLIRALVEEQRAHRDVQPDGRITMPRGQAARVSAAYASASQHADLAAEAHVRWGFHHLELGEVDEALRQFDAAGDPEDIAVRYWLHLFHGQAFDRADRRTDAIAAYRQAIDDAPFAQPPRIALAAALVVDHRTSEASREIAQALAGVDRDAIDPLMYYGHPDLRFWPAFLALLRQVIVR